VPRILSLFVAAIAGAAKTVVAASINPHNRVISLLSLFKFDSVQVLPVRQYVARHQATDVQ
jgi:hypothetical protein